MNSQSSQNQTQISKTGNTTSTTQASLAELHKKNNDNMLHKSYYDPGYPGELNEWSVLDYFCQPPNPFFDKSSNNAIIQQQQIHMAKLRDMKGIEYQVLHAQPPIMFIVQKCERFSPDKLKPLANYYVIDRKVYQAPDLVSVLTSRLTSTLSHLKSAYGKVLDKSKYHPSIGYWWKHDELAKTKQYERDQDTQKNANAFERYTTGSLLNKLQHGIATKRDKRPESSSLANQTQTNVNTSEQNNPPTKRRKIDKVATVVSSAPDK
jgi:mediator of RNA polymerase II transcription subunit 6